MDPTGTAGTTRRGRRLAGAVPLLAPLIVAAALAGAAVVTVEQAGCDAPGHVVATGEGARFVPGCLAPLDVPDAPAAGRGVDADSRRG